MATISAADALRFYAPGGQRLASSSQRPALSGDPVNALRARHARAGLNIGPQTLSTSTWQGERMDYSWAVDSLARKAAWHGGRAELSGGGADPHAGVRADTSLPLAAAPVEAISAQGISPTRSAF